MVLNSKTIIILLAGFLITLIITNITNPYYQYTTALSPSDTVEKLFGGFFHKPQQKQTSVAEISQTQQNIKTIHQTPLHHHQFPFHRHPVKIYHLVVT